MIAPLLPNAEGLVDHLRGNIDYVLIDRMNYHYADWVYREHGLEYALTQEYFTQKKMEMSKALREERIPYQLLF